MISSEDNGIRKRVKEVWVTRDNREFDTKELAELYENTRKLTIEIENLADYWADNSPEKIAQYLLKHYDIKKKKTV